MAGGVCGREAPFCIKGMGMAGGVCGREAPFCMKGVDMAVGGLPAPKCRCCPKFGPPAAPIRSALWAFRPKSADGVQNLVRLRHRRRALWAFRPQSARRVHVHNHAVRIVPAVRSIIMIMCIPYYVVQELALIAAVLSMVYKAIAAAKYIFTF